MKKFLALILSAFMLLTVAGCGNAKNDNISSVPENSSNVTSAATSDNSGVSDDKISEAKDVLSKYVDLSQYSETIGTTNITYEFNGDKSCDISMDAITIDGDNLSVPFTYNDLVAKGWTCLSDPEQMVNAAKEPTQITGTVIVSYPGVLPPFKNSKGLKIMTEFSNYEPKEMSVKDCIGVRVRFNCKKDDGTKVEFNIAGITNNDNLSEVISKIGTPWKFVYDTSNDNITVYFNNSSCDTSMYIIVTPTGEVTDVSYENRPAK